MVAVPPLGSEAVEQVIAILLRLMLNGELAGGQRLRQDELARRLGVSRMPLRSALQILTADGLVTYSPNRGYAVFEMTYDDFRQVRKMRAAIETQALASIEWPSAEQLAELRSLNERHYAAGRAGDYAESAHLHRLFHDSILGLSRLTLVVREYHRVQTLSDLYHFRYIDDDESLEESLHDHTRMIRALEERDLESLVHVRRAHSREFESQVRRLRGVLMSDENHLRQELASSAATSSR